MKYCYQTQDNWLYHVERAGKEFEGDMFNALCMKNDKVKNTIGTRLDKYEGTDFIYDDIRLDATTDFSNKKYMPYCFDTGIKAANGKNFMIGIRIGVRYEKKDAQGNPIIGKNGRPISIYENFPEPVVVIGVDMEASEYKQYQERITSRLERKEIRKDSNGNVMKTSKGEPIVDHPIMDKLIDLAVDAYDDYTTKNKEARKELFSTPLKKNEMYRQSKFTNKRYIALNELQNMIMASKDTEIEDLSYL